MKRQYEEEERYFKVDRGPIRAPVVARHDSQTAAAAKRQAASRPKIYQHHHHHKKRYHHRS